MNNRIARTGGILLSLLLIFTFFCACKPVPVDGTETLPPQSTPVITSQNTPTSENQSQHDLLLSYLVNEIAGTEKQHRYIVLVTTQDSRAPLSTDKDTIQQCWLFLDSLLTDCTASEFSNSFLGENPTSWDYSYVLLAITALNSEYTEATIRLDELSGPQTRQGFIYTLIKENNNWEIESRKLLWSG